MFIIILEYICELIVNIENIFFNYISLEVDWREESQELLKNGTMSENDIKILESNDERIRKHIEFILNNSKSKKIYIYKQKLIVYRCLRSYNLSHNYSIYVTKMIFKDLYD